MAENAPESHYQLSPQTVVLLKQYPHVEEVGRVLAEYPEATRLLLHETQEHGDTSLIELVIEAMEVDDVIRQQTNP